MCSSLTSGSPQRVVLVVELDDRPRQLLALGDAEALRERAGGVVAHHHLERDHLDHADQLLAHVEPADEVRRHADGVQPGHEVLAEPVVQHALALDRRLLLGVERGRLVLEVLDQRVRLRSFVENLRLALIDQPASGHACLRRCAKEKGGRMPAFPVPRSLYPGPERSKLSDDARAAHTGPGGEPWTRSRRYTPGGRSAATRRARSPRDLVEEILWDAAQAPTTPVSGPWLFTVVAGRARVAGLGERAKAYARANRPCRTGLSTGSTAPSSACSSALPSRS